MEQKDLWTDEPDLVALNAAYNRLKSDPVDALTQLQELSNRGSRMSMVYVGDAFRRGVGTARDVAEAERWFRRAYEQGSMEGLRQLGSLYLDLKKFDAAEKIFSEGISKKYTPAMDRLATLYLQSSNLEKLQQARMLLEEASALGNVIARRHLAGLLLTGRFGIREMFRGLRLFWQALRDGWALAKNDPRSEYLR